MRRARDRAVLNAYEAATTSRTRRNPSDNRSGNSLTALAGSTLRGQARHLEQNHDIVRGILSTLVNNVVGPKGIGIEPNVKNANGETNKEFNDQIEKLLKDWAQKPETTHQLTWAKTQRLVARAWFRDGECLSKSVAGLVTSLDHKTKVPFSIELLEADHIADVNDNVKVWQGIEVNGWGQPVFYHLYDNHPSEASYLMGTPRKVSAGLIDHIKFTDRFKQLRGVSVFSSVLNRLNDLKDYEDSERIAAKIAANMAAYIKKGSADHFTPGGEAETDDREFVLGMGTIWDNLEPGEDIGTIQSNRPSQLLLPFRNAMLRAIASGTHTGYSSISKSYDGTYSAQRQELIEQWAHYQVLSDEFISMFVEPTYRRFVKIAMASGVLKVPPSIDKDTLFDAAFLTPSMPWIDPKKEAEGHKAMLEEHLTTPQKIIRQRGDNPTDVLDQWQQWEKELRDRNLKNDEPAPAGFFTPGEKTDG